MNNLCGNKCSPFDLEKSFVKPKGEEWILSDRSDDTISESDDDSDDEPGNRAGCQRKRKRGISPKSKAAFFKRYFDADRYDTDSFDEEVPLKSPHVDPKMSPSYYAPRTSRGDLPCPIREEDEEEKYQKRLEFEFGPDKMEGHRQTPFEDSAFFNGFLQDYLGGPIKRWKPITSSRDKIEIEPLVPDIFPPLKPYKPILVEVDTVGGGVVTVQRVCGYREILEKRARVEQLRWIEAMSRTTPLKKKSKKLRTKQRCATTVGLPTKVRTEASLPQAISNTLNSSDDESFPVERESISAISENSSLSRSSGQEIEPSSYSYGQPDFFSESAHYGFENRFWPILVGGGDKAPPENPPAPEAPPAAEQPPAESTVVLVAPPPPAEPIPTGAEPNQLATEPSSSFQELGTTTEGESTTVGESEAEYEDDEGPEQVAEYEDTSHAYEKDVEDDDDIDENWIENLNVTEKDNEWLQLSSSESEEIFFQHETIPKPKKPWMNPATAYESQNLGRSLHRFMIFIAAFGRLSFFTRQDAVVGLSLFSVNSLPGLPFRFTSTILWIIFVTTAQSAVDILYGTEDQEFSELESAELQQYKVAVMGMIVNLCFVAICSMAIMLKDSFHVCQYMNFMAAAVSKMEISATRRLGRTVILNMILTFGYCALMIVAFVFDTPKTIRESSGFFAMLACRPLRYRIRQVAFNNVLAFQIIGLVLHLFCYVSLRFIFTHMHVLAVVIGNLAKNWNFRFGLCFAQFGTHQRAHAYRLHFGQSLIKLFTHHRLISGLTHFYGSIFAIPIVTHYILQIALVSSVLIILFFEIYSRESTSNSNTIPIPGEKEKTITLASGSDSVVTSAFVLAHFIFEFILVSEVISGACGSVMNSFEFVRRNGLLRCKNTHEVRLLMSLQWSMSEKNPALLNVNNFFYVNRPGILASLGFSIVIVSLVIQLKQTSLATLVLECTQGLKVTKTYDFKSCYEFRLVSENLADTVANENKELIERIKAEVDALPDDGFINT